MSGTVRYRAKLSGINSKLTRLFLSGGLILSLAKVIADAPLNHGHQPGLEGAHLGIVFELLDLLGYGKDGLLHDVLRFSRGESGSERNIVDEPPVEIEELLPAGSIVPVLQSQQQALPG